MGDGGCYDDSPHVDAMTAWLRCVPRPVNNPTKVADQERGAGDAGVDS